MSNPYDQILIDTAIVEDFSGLKQYMAAAASVLSGAIMSGCGAGTGKGPAQLPPTGPIAPTPGPPTATQASRFLMQASMGATREQIAKVQELGYAGWLDDQIATPVSGTSWAWLVGAGFATSTESEAGTDACIWRKLLSAPDTLRQRVTLALSEIIVGAVSGFFEGQWRAFSAATLLDLLQANAFGNYRILLQQISLSTPMGEFLTYIDNMKFDPATGAMPDENFAREIMQLFSIGLIQLNPDGSPKLVNGKPQETYTLDDVVGLARVFTGYGYDATFGYSTPEYKRLPLIQLAGRHEYGSKKFLGTTIVAGTNPADSLAQALDTIFAHPNVAPFIGKQLIQRLVCSNPSSAYVARVSAVFNNDGNGVKGNLTAVLKAILLDEEARADIDDTAPGYGKLREPILRLAAWARAFKATSPSDTWNVGDTSDAGKALAQSPLRAPSVFNFFRPGYVPPNSEISNSGMVAPEFQITNETSVVGYVNFMQRVICDGIGDVKADYGSLLPLADNARTLVDEINLVLTAGQLSATTVVLIVGALNTLPSGTDASRLARIHATLVMVMAAPEFIVQK
ncbi:DUF1800 domain-containing protein [Massilia glaciei]|uniref:DUF1800 domain-containing protein n=1 Tax=Massilia glaciei TaxID=1524097 RepID=A0A2U2HGP9_9BURK|nr:DUF1800 family protein [Massilia glaciei]PWF44360.1 DUF1800 domain-containing protein [Massilia glaciei]